VIGILQYLVHHKYEVKVDHAASRLLTMLCNVYNSIAGKYRWGPRFL